MGFYGNVTNTNRTQFVFDKIYSSRTNMDKAVSTDGIFIGRFVLVDYNEGFDTPELYQRLYKHDIYNQWYLDETKKNRAEYYDALYYIENEDGSSSVNPLADQPEYRDLIFKDEPIYVIENGEYVFYQCTGVDTVYHKYATFTKMAKGPSDTDAYYNNFAKDRATYGKDIGRGWDSTVWQKVYADDVEKYVLIAELNSVVPTLDVTVDAPTINPIAPHFDADSTNVYYRLHVQPSWGMAVAPADVEKGEYSDEQVSYSGSQWNPALGKQEWISKKYDGAIYFNKDGFDPDYRYEKKKIDDEISLLPTGKSGTKYNDSHESGRETKTVQPDIQELKINLPSIGDTISSIWDLVYGTGELAEGEENIYRRNKNIAWNNIAGERLVRENIDGTGFDYDPEQVDTIAGCINSVHDLMGMIITQETQKQGESDEEFKERISIENALTNRIYYGNYEPDRILNGKPYQGFYIKSLTYEYDTDTHENVVQEVDLKDFFAKNYYYINNNNYYLEVNGYRGGNNYYTLDGKVTPKTDLYEKDWEPNKYYYLENGDYILDGNKWPDENKIYYIIEPGFQTEVDATQNIFFFPEDEDYFKAYFSDQKGEKDENGIAFGNGLFYLTTEPDTNIPLYKPFHVGLPYQTPLYWFDNYRIETSTGIDGEPVEVYDFDKGAVKTELTMIQFLPDTYFWFNPETNDYETLLTQKEIIEKDENGQVLPISKIYKSFKQESITEVPGDFYEPDLYYYQEGNDYILATEETRAKDLNNYFIIGAPDPVKDIFYEPNYYHYKDEITGEYVIDVNPFITPDRQYYIIHFLHVEYDPNGILLPGSKINANIDLSKLPGLQYGPRYETYEWKELIGFARTLNTIHGLLMDMNNTMRTDDALTRDRGTIQGCINTINDIINNIYELIPGRFIIVDDFGRMTSATHVYDNWIEVLVDPSRNRITFNHVYNAGESKTEETDLNDGTDTIDLYTPNVDERGHIIGEYINTITLPYGYKTVIAENSDSVAAAGEETGNAQSAENTQDTLNLKASNKWIKLDDSEKKTIQIGHLLSPATPNTQFGLSGDLSIDDLDINNTFQVPNFTFDEAGHIIDAQTHTIVLPETFTKIKVIGTSNLDTVMTAADATVEPDTLTDELTLASGNQWIKLAADATEDAIRISHASAGRAIVEVGEVESETLAYEKAFTMPYIGFDRLGHMSFYELRELQMPTQPSKTLLVDYTDGELLNNNLSINEAFKALEEEILNYQNSNNEDISGINTEISGIKGTLDSHTRLIEINTQNISDNKQTLNQHSVMIEDNTRNISNNYNEIEYTKGIVDNNTLAIEQLQNNVSTLENRVGNNSSNIATEQARAIAKENEIIDMIPSYPTTAGYYILQIKDDGSHEWIAFDYTPPTPEENPEEPIE